MSEVNSIGDSFENLFFLGQNPEDIAYEKEPIQEKPAQDRLPGQSLEKFLAEYVNHTGPENIRKDFAVSNLKNLFPIQGRSFVALNAKGDTAICYENKEGLFVSTKKADGSWSESKKILKIDGRLVEIQIELNPDGLARVLTEVYEDDDGGSTLLVWQKADGSWTNPVNMNRYADVNNCSFHPFFNDSKLIHLFIQNQQFHELGYLIIDSESEQMLVQEASFSSSIGVSSVDKSKQGEWVVSSLLNANSDIVQLQTVTFDPSEMVWKLEQDKILLDTEFVRGAKSAVGPNGEKVVVWANTETVKAKFLGKSGASIDLTLGDFSPTHFTMLPPIFDKEGNLMVAWATCSKILGEDVVYAAYKPFNQAMSFNIEILKFPIDTQIENVQFELIEAGRFLFVWEEKSDKGNYLSAIKAGIYSAKDRAFETKMQLSPIESSCYSPVLSLKEPGKAVIYWKSDSENVIQSVDLSIPS